MAIDPAAGFRDIGSATMNYIPEVWSGQLLTSFYDNTVCGSITNTNWQGEIKGVGNTVRIRTVPRISINAVKKGQNLVFEQPESNSVDLTIDYADAWSFITDSIDNVQTDIKNYADLWIQDAAEGLAIETDTNILSAVYSDAHASNQGATAGYRSANINLGVSGTPLALTKTNIIEKIVDLGVVMDEQNAPKDRFLVMPPSLCALVAKSDLKDASLAGDGKSILRNGLLGRIWNFEIYASNLLTTTSDGGHTVYNCVFGTKEAIAFADQITENKVTDNPFGFGWLHKGLHVYGFKTVKPEALGWLYAYGA